MQKTMPLFRVLAVLACLAAFTATAHAESMKLTIEEAVSHALANNPQIEAVRAGVTGAEFGEKSTWGAFGPSVTLNYGYTHYDHERAAIGREDDLFSAAINIHQDLFTGFRLLNSHQKAKITKDRAELQLTNAEIQLIRLVQSNFLTLLSGRNQVRSAEDAVKRLESQLKVTKAFYDVGLKPRLDVLEAEVELSDAQDKLLQAQNLVATQHARLNTLLTLPLDADVEYVGELEFAPFTLPLTECVNRAKVSRPDLRIAAKSIDIAVRDAGIAKSALYPQVGADFDLSRVGDDPTVDGHKYARTEFSSWSLSLGAQWQVFAWGENWYAWKQAKEGVTRLVAEADNTLQEATFEVQSNYLNIGEATKRIKVARKSVELALEGYRMAVARYQAQVGTNTDVLDAQARLTNAEASLTSALADYQIALANIYASMGEKNISLKPE